MPAVVGIGAGPGGLAPLKVLLEHVPADSGLALVIVAQVPADQGAPLADLLQPHARFPVEEASQATPIEPNRAYIIPADADLMAIQTHLRWTPLEERRRERAPIDHLLRMLAGTYDGHTIAVILTGNGSDGTLGIQDVKANGGVIIVQDPAEAEYGGMPKSAIATGLVDLVLPVVEIPERILRYVRARPSLRVPAETEVVPQGETFLLSKALAVLQARTGRDFSRYKRTTMLRRIARRMQLNSVEDLATYVERLQEQPEEVRALAEDLLITVTRFFRDPEVFERLQRVEMERLFTGKGRADSVRVWSVGCATGEEAYSLAMLLVEEAERHEVPLRIQLFASDLHSRSLEKAREGFYPSEIATDVGAERLQRFFQREAGGYRVRKELRELVVFSSNNLLTDAPFSRLDLISCRNLLIYLERELQQEVIELFHYVLRPEGLLVLGSAESMNPTELFQEEDEKLCLFRKRSVPSRRPRLPVFPLTQARFSGSGGASAEIPGLATAHGKQHQQMVEKHAPPSLLVGADNRVLHLSPNVSRYLLRPEGEPTQDALEMVREELRPELQLALEEVRANRASYDSRPIAVRFDEQKIPVVLRVRPSLESEEEGLALVIFEERERLNPTEEGRKPGWADVQQIEDLKQALQTAQQSLADITEAYESGKAVMKASAKDRQSTTEELRSAMEELETSRQELQSINLELQAANQKTRRKVEELDLLSSDLQNLLISTDIATLFLDRDLRILRFTPKLGDLFNVRGRDRGRPISDLTHRLGYDDLRRDAETVLGGLVPVERELQDDAGKWYLTRIRPYRDSDDRINGVVVTFVDITDRKDAERMRLEIQARQQATATEQAIRKKEAELARVSRTLMVGELATSIAHEVNQPLVGVITNAQAGLRWLEGAAPNIDEARQSLELIVRDGNRAGNVIQRVRAFVKKESSGAAALDLGQVVRETITLLEFDMEHKGISLVLDISEGLPLIHGDRTQLEQVILNLVINAVEAMAGVEDRPCELVVSVKSAGAAGVLVAVGDSGTGMDPNHIDRICDAFFTTKANGVGMGLSISRSIIEAHGGRIWATQNDGPGLTVQFSLPVDATNPR
ncbi:CheR family methyltransferase [Paludibaculum fermentans]|uniref:histidine kinase n=1 Tax=Paludibaculum fermentans TaxID=1473598 RepID=A0A7S7SLA5_PALFE|nr:CheR family methyltransferase [Paludibaculum fermentans]QOY90052.1 PAS domain-containing protein [Paludibaculum fermentans]